MAEETKQNTPVKEQNDNTQTSEKKEEKVSVRRGRVVRGNGGKEGKGGRERRGGRGGFNRERSEFDQKIINTRRVTRVVSGGRRFSFSVWIVIGDRKGRVGVGTGKSTDTATAIEKAVRDAKKNMFTIPLTQAGSIPHEVSAKYNSAQVTLMPAPGKGVVAGSAVRIICDLGGVKDVGGKVISRSKNKLNIARATIKALESLKTKK